MKPIGIVKILSVVFALIPNSSWSQIKIDGDNNKCNVVARDNSGTLNVSCSGIDPAVVEKLLNRLEILEIEKSEIVEVANGWAAKYLEIKKRLESVEGSGSAVQAAWRALNAADVDLAEVLVSSLSGMERSLTSIERLSRLDLSHNVLKQAIDLADGSQRGQNEAIETLIAGGYTFEGADFSGVSFRRGNLADFVASNSKMHAVDLRDADLRRADLSSATVHFGSLESANLSNAKLINFRAPLTIAKGANFDNAKLDEAIIVLSDLTNASFRGASLRGAALAMSDLSGADFSGADLTGAYLVGSILDKARFEGAIVDDLNVLGTLASGRVFSRNQSRKVCQHKFKLRRPEDGLILSITILEQWPSNRLGGGYEVRSDDAFLASYARLEQFLDPAQTSLRECNSPNETPTRAFIAYAPDDYRYLADRAYFGKANRERAIRDRASEIAKRLQGFSTIGRPTWVN